MSPIGAGIAVVRVILLGPLKSAQRDKLPYCTQPPSA